MNGDSVLSRPDKTWFGFTNFRIEDKFSNCDFFSDKSCEDIVREDEYEWLK